MLLGRMDSVGPLVVQLFARDHVLTDAESRVLHILGIGTRPSEIATELGAALSTVCTHLQTIRSKTCTNGLFELALSVAMLPRWQAPSPSEARCRTGPNGRPSEVD